MSDAADAKFDSDFAKIFMGKTIPHKDPDTVPLEFHNNEMNAVMTIAKATVEAAILEERNQCALIAEELKSDEIAKAIRNRIPSQSVHLN